MKSNTNTKLFAALSYITWIGWIISFIFRDKDDEVVKFHLNQALSLKLLNLAIGAVYKIAGSLIITRLCGLAAIAVFVCMVIGIIRAINLSTEKIPFVGDLSLIK